MDFEKIKEAGILCKELKKKAKNIIKEGVSYLEVIEFVEKEIETKNFKPAFPTTICANNIAAHFTIYDEDLKFKKGDVIKLDFGISNDGWIVDNALTIEISTNKSESQIKANEKGLRKLLDFIEIDLELREIGKFIQNYAKERGFETIKNLSGHEIKRNNLHAGLNIPNNENGDKRKISDNSILAIEPFFSKTTSKVISSGNSNILHLKHNKNVRDRIAREVLNYIKKEFPYLPFSKRWLLKKFDKRKINYAINLLKKEDIIYEYPILKSDDNSIITQFEETLVFKNKKKYIITNLENGN